MRSSRSVPFRALSVLSLAAAAVVLVTGISPGATRYLTKKRALKLFYTKAAANAAFIQDTVFYREGPPVLINNLDEGYAQVGCPDGTMAVSGGGRVQYTNMFIEVSFATDGTLPPLTPGTVAWAVWAKNNSGASGNLWPYVICLRADTVDSNFT